MLNVSTEANPYFHPPATTEDHDACVNGDPMQAKE
jgi:hypothetical protein